MEGLGSFSCLPRDLLLRVLLSFRLSSLVALSQTSKTFSSRVQESLELRASRAPFPSGSFSPVSEDFDFPGFFGRGEKRIFSVVFACDEVEQLRGRVIVSLSSTFGCSQSSGDETLQLGGFFSVDPVTLNVKLNLVNWYSRSTIYSNHRGNGTTSHYCGRKASPGSAMVSGKELELEVQQDGEKFEKVLKFPAKTAANARMAFQEIQRMWGYWNLDAHNGMYDIDRYEMN